MCQGNRGEVSDDMTARAWWTAQAGGDVWQGIKARVDGEVGEEIGA